MAKKVPLSELTDQELVAELKKKLKKRNVIQLKEYFANPEVDRYFQEIYKRYQGPLENYCSKFVYDRDLLSDIFHDIFIKIYINIHKYHYDKSFKAWVYRIAHNSCINYRRKTRNQELPILNKKISASESTETEYIDLFQSDETGVENLLINQEIKDAIDGAVDKLPFDLANVFLLKTDGQLTFEEIARILKISSRSVKSFFQNAVIFIKEEMDKKNLHLKDLKE